jgi:hypothetical protein
MPRLKNCHRANSRTHKTIPRTVSEVEVSVPLPENDLDSYQAKFRVKLGESEAIEVNRKALTKVERWRRVAQQEGNIIRRKRAGKRI